MKKHILNMQVDIAKSIYSIHEDFIESTMLRLGFGHKTLKVMLMICCLMSIMGVLQLYNSTRRLKVKVTIIQQCNNQCYYILMCIHDTTCYS